jgi:site-specific DNA-methyltransferase (adenine-specific)
LFASARTEWETPADLFAVLDREFAFTLDVCALPSNSKCAAFFSPADDALRRPWTGRCWMNPPYGREIAAWVRKAREAGRKHASVVCLLPARTDTAWWHQHVMRAPEIRLLRGRLTFVGARSSAPFPSAVVIFDQKRVTSGDPRVVSWDWRAALAGAARAAA